MGYPKLILILQLNYLNDIQLWQPELVGRRVAKKD